MFHRTSVQRSLGCASLVLAVFAGGCGDSDTNESGSAAGQGGGAGQSSSVGGAVATGGAGGAPLSSGGASGSPSGGATPGNGGSSGANAGGSSPSGGASGGSPELGGAGGDGTPTAGQGDGGQSPGTGGNGDGGSSEGGSATTGGSSAGGEGGTAPVTCEEEEAPMPTGETIDVTPPESLEDALAEAGPGDRIVLHEGDYEAESIQGVSFDDFVFVEAAEGEDVTLPGLVLEQCDHIVLDGMTFEGTLELAGSSDLLLRNITLDGGDGDDHGLHFQGQGGVGAAHDIVVRDSTIGGGGRTIFVLGSFAPSEEWNHHLTFLDNEITCGSAVCFQISGGRDLLIENNRIFGNGSNGILTAGATRVTIARNRFEGDGSSAMQIATPGAEWDDFAGVENMISSEIMIANNVIDGFGTGITFDAATEVSIVYNTVAEGTGIRLNHRVPRDQEDNVILDGNSEIRVWNNVLPSIVIAEDEERPAFESNNVVWGDGGGGDNLIGDEPDLDAGADYRLLPGSSGIDEALSNAETPLGDFGGFERGDDPDIGAHELGATTPLCP